MIKLATTIIMLLFLSSLGAQSVSKTSTAEQCLQLMERILSENDSFSQYDFQGTRITRKAKINNEHLEESYINVDWASYGGLVTKKGNDSLKVTLSFDREHAFFSKLIIGNFTGRDVYRSNSVQFNLSPGLSDKLPEIEKAAERLKQLAKSNASPILKSDLPTGWIKTIPTRENYNRNHERFEKEIAPWDLGFLNDNGKVALVLVEIGPDGQQKQAAVMHLDMIRAVDDDGKDIQFSAFVQYRPDADYIFDVFPEFRLPLTKSQSGGDRSWIIRHFRFFLWKSGVQLLKNGYSIGDEGYAFVVK